MELKEKMESTQRLMNEMEEREVLLMKDIEDTKAKHAFAQAEFETERDELNDLVTKSRLLLQVSENISLAHCSSVLKLLLRLQFTKSNLTSRLR